MRTFICAARNARIQGQADEPEARHLCTSASSFRPMEPSSERAIRHGLALAKLVQAQIVGVHSDPAAAQRHPAQSDSEFLRRHHSRRNSQTCGRKTCCHRTTWPRSGLPVETVKPSNDHPWEAIVHTAKDKQCDLIVMASHGRRGVAPALFWKRNAQVLTHSTRSRPGRRDKLG